MASGTTPQRRELVYPRELIKLQSRSELLETLRKQQEALQDALQEEEGEQEDEDMQDTLEDELSTCNESLATDPSFVDENLVFNESKRLPFFKVSDKSIPPVCLVAWRLVLYRNFRTTWLKAA